MEGASVVDQARWACAQRGAVEDRAVVACEADAFGCAGCLEWDVGGFGGADCCRWEDLLL